VNLSRRYPRWSVTTLTVPEREACLLRLLASLREAGAGTATEVVVVYNAPPREPRPAITRRIAEACPDHDVVVRFNDGRQTIADGRNLQLASCRAPLVCFVDDDVTLHGPVFPTLERALSQNAVALVGLPSLRDDTAERYKPRAGTPRVGAGTLQYMHVQGTLCAGFREVWLGVGGFNVLRAFWGEWTDLNTRLWRRGYPTAYQSGPAYLRHWCRAPHVSAQDRAERASHILWGLACTALEYDAVARSPSSTAFWDLIRQRYLPIAFETDVTPEEVFRTMLELAPRLAQAWPLIRAARGRAATDPFSFGPFHPLDAEAVRRVRDHGARALLRVRSAAFPVAPRPIAGPPRGARGRFETRRPAVGTA
jgi:Glycosyl transferase family 2